MASTLVAVPFVTSSFLFLGVIASTLEAMASTYSTLVAMAS